MSAFDRVQTTTAASSGVAMTLAHAFPAPVQSGSALLVAVMANVAPFGVTVQDDRGNAYTEIATFGPGSSPAQMMSVWRCATAFGGATTVTITNAVASAFVAHYFEFVGPLGLPVETDEASGTAVDGFREDRYWPTPGDGDPYFALVLGLAVGASNLTLWGTALTEQNQPDDALTTFDPPPPITLRYTISDEDSGPTGAIDTTGANLVVLCIPYWNDPPKTLVVTDSKSNLWTPLTAYGAPGTLRVQFFYCLHGTVGLGHTFSVSGTLGPIVVYQFTGVQAYQTETGTGLAGSPSAPQSPGSVTPAADGALILTAFASAGEWGEFSDTVAPDVFNDAVPEGSMVWSTAHGVQVTVGCYIQPTAAPMNPAWSWTGGPRTDIALTTAVFLPVNYAVPEAYRTKTANPTTLAP